MVAWCRK